MKRRAIKTRSAARVVERSEQGVAGAPCCSEVNFDAHLAEHVLHRRAHVISDDCLDLMLCQEAGDAGVVPPLGSGIVESTPADFELLPVIDRVGRYSRDRDTISAAPTRIHETFLCDRNADNHFERLHVTGEFGNRRPGRRMATVSVMRTSIDSWPLKPLPSQEHFGWGILIPNSALTVLSVSAPRSPHRHERGVSDRLGQTNQVDATAYRWLSII